MQSSEFPFRFRQLALFLLFVLGFWAPWERLGGAHPGSTWLWLAGAVARYGILPIGVSSIAVMVVAILLAVLAALLRTWATAYLGGSMVWDRALHGERIAADGPYRYVRNPLYLGTWLHTLALGILMPPGGALFAAVAVAALNAVLIHAEETHLTAQRGEGYAAYARKVSRLIPALTPRVPGGTLQPSWGNGFLGEIYYWGVAITYLLFANRYNVTILEQGVLISMGIAFLVQAMRRPAIPATS